MKRDRTLEFIDNYNWDDGFECMRNLVSITNCSLANLLTIFYDAGGYEYLDFPDNPTNRFPEGHAEFLVYLFNAIEKRASEEVGLNFEYPLTRVQRYKLRKKNPNVAKVFLGD